MDFKDLIKVLEAETEIYKSFAETENEKTGVIIEGDVEKLDAILILEQELYMKVQSIEKARMGVIKNLGLEKNTLVDVIALSGGSQKVRLAELFDELNNNISAIKQLNEYNTRLVKSRLEIISDMTRLYEYPGAKKPGGSSGSTKGEATYGKDAKVMRQPESFERAVVRKKM